MNENVLDADSVGVSDLDKGASLGDDQYSSINDVEGFGSDGCLALTVGEVSGDEENASERLAEELVVASDESTTEDESVVSGFVRANSSFVPTDMLPLLPDQ